MWLDKGGNVSSACGMCSCSGATDYKLLYNVQLLGTTVISFYEQRDIITGIVLNVKTLEKNKQR